MSSSRQNDGPGRPGNAKPFTVSLSKKTTENKPSPFRSQLPSSKGFPKPSTPKLPNRALYQDFSDEEEDAQPAHQEVVGFDSTAGGAISKHAAAEEKAPLVIKVESKNNWRDRPGVNRRSKNLLPQEVQAAGAAVVETEEPSVAYGLSLAPSREADINNNVVAGAEEGKDADIPDAAGPSTDQKPAPLGQDELALQALISESQGNNDRKRSNLVIESSNSQGRYDETSSFRTDVATRPDQASLEAYNAIPVEEFGAALLRGMGWKEGQSIGRGKYGGASTAAAKAVVPERRPGFLGIGAKDISGDKGAETEIGAWGKAAMRKGSRKGGDSSGNTEGIYMPIVMKNKSTGEQLTEEEFKTRQLEAKGRAATANGRDRERRHRYDDEGESSTRHRRRERSRDSSSRRHRDRSRSSGAHDRRSRRYEDDRGSDRDHRRYRDRSDRDYKDRSSRRDDYKSSRRDRDDDRDRDRHDRSGRDRRDNDSGRDRDRYKDSSRRRC
ncbi:hypothetical protein PISL3812_05009 [Talaromyces islandicus]|uniref:Pre-mRNA-splicing factor n=1 Tax=Talaromyces islandicus TaxID=28573 RepID=A0A0U1LX73_TALIS|nr:hypothetical protein PISL3812_05009 [Talaromyces islandicus]